MLLVLRGTSASNVAAIQRAYTGRSHLSGISTVPLEVVTLKMLLVLLRTGVSNGQLFDMHTQANANRHISQGPRYKLYTVNVEIFACLNSHVVFIRDHFVC